MELVQDFHIHSGFIIVAFGKTAAHDLHQIGITRIVLRQQYEMIITILTAGQLLVKPGIRRNVHLAAEHRIDVRFFAGTVKINDAVHHAVIRDRRAVHAQFLDTLHIFFDLVGAIQKTVFRMSVKMYKRHDFLSCCCSNLVMKKG